MKKQNVRVRYAPSPSGFLHIGNARTALFNYLFAQHHKGTFIIRNENTDTSRHIEGAIESQVNNLEWLGIKADESQFQTSKKGGPYTQLERLDLYSKHANVFLAKGFAYHCFCTDAELTAMKKEQFKNKNRFFKYTQRCLQLSASEIRDKLANNQPYCLRLKVPANQIYKFNDMVRGIVTFESQNISDWVIMKTSKIPTYNFAVAIDDWLMKISHVIRGEEHLSNTPNQIMVFNYLEQQPPVYAHLTIIINENRKKLSKRDANINFFISKYKNMGYLADALFNYMALLGWSPNMEEEIFTVKQLIKLFDDERWSASPSMFDVKKLRWINNYYIKNLNQEDYFNLVRPFLASRFSEADKDDAWLETLMLIYQRELQYGQQILQLTDYFWQNTREINPALIEEMRKTSSR